MQQPLQQPPQQPQHYLQEFSRTDNATSPLLATDMTATDATTPQHQQQQHSHNNHHHHRHPHMTTTPPATSTPRDDEYVEGGGERGGREGGRHIYGIPQSQCLFSRMFALRCSCSNVNAAMLRAATLDTRLTEALARLQALGEAQYFM